jgi:hypothetical protein
MDVLVISQQTAIQLAVLDSLSQEQISKIFRVSLKMLVMGETKAQLGKQDKALYHVKLF